MKLKDVRTLVDYLYEDEARHYEENKTKDHIFLAIKRLDEYLSKKGR